MGIIFKQRERITKPDKPLDTPAPAPAPAAPPEPQKAVDVVIIPMEHAPPEQAGKPSPENDCLLAIAAWAEGMKVGTLMIVHRENGSGYEVVRAAPDPTTESVWRLTIMGANGVEGQPRFTRRENEKYRPLWR